MKGWLHYWSGGINVFNENYIKLRSIASELGYTVTIVDSHFVSSCGHLTKHINISKKSGDIKCTFEFAHELGHCKQFKRRWIKFNGDKEIVKQFYRDRDKKKYKFMFDEFDAWRKGYFILKQTKINTYGYWNHALCCLWSHLMKTNPNTVKN